MASFTAMETTKLAFCFHDIGPGKLSVTKATLLRRKSLQKLVQSLSLQFLSKSRCYVFALSFEAEHADLLLNVDVR